MEELRNGIGVDTEQEELDQIEDVSEDEILLNEQDLIRGLLEAAGEKSADESYTKIEISRKGKVLFYFRIRPLGEDEYNECREKSTKYVRNNKLGGMKLPEDTNTVKYRSRLIYAATHPEDKAKLWDNKAIWKQLNVLNAIDVIDKALLGGEKDAVIDKLDAISGYNSNVEVVAKK